MSIPEHTLWTRKDIARILGPNVTERKVRRNERSWLLVSARVKGSNKPTLYCSQKVIASLRTLGMLT